MNYSADRPIENGEQDLLGRASFSKQLGKAIYEYEGKDGLVIGLFGKWGTGKTSVINMATCEINKLAENDENKPLIIRFAPWNYSDKDNLIKIFFQNLKNKISIQDNEKLKKKVGKALQDYSDAFDAFSAIPVVGIGIASVFKSLAKAQGTKLMKDADLDNTKIVLEKALAEINKKIVIVIDDIDRLTNPQIMDIFQLVKQVADFPNIIYVLAMDREVVRNALTGVHNIDGNEYLEKIIQIPFELPELKRTKLHNIFFSKLDYVIKNLPKSVEWDQNYWNNVFRNCIEPYIHTLRDVNRVINTFQFRYGMLYQETSFEDMVGITTLEVLEPDLYKWICNNKDAVCGGFMHSFLSTSGNKPDYRKRYKEEFERLGIDPDKAISCISTMFPVFAQDVSENHFYSFEPSSAIRSKMRVAHEERFDLYFMFDLDDIKVSRSLIYACMYELDKDEMIQALFEVNKQGNIVYFLEEMRSLVDKIPYERLPLIASVLFGIQGNFNGENTRHIFPLSAIDYAEYLLEDIIKRLETENEKFEVISQAVKNVSKDGLGSIARMINRIELAYGRLAGDVEKKDDQLISVEHLEEIEKYYVERINYITSSEQVFTINGFSFAFYLWECFDKKGAKEYLDKMFKDEILKLKFICGLAGKWNGTTGSGWSFYSKDYSEYLTKEEIYNLISDLDKAKLDEFSEIEQIKLASFFLNYDRDEMDYANEQEALKLIKEWKANK